MVVLSKGCTQTGQAESIVNWILNALSLSSVSETLSLSFPLWDFQVVRLL